jgi:SAM-dependent methyltransferase
MLIYALTILISSFLLFLVQPIIAKQIVPWFGGSAGVWTTCLTFFQLVLLAGYAYSDWIQRFAPRIQSVIHVTLLAASLLAMPIIAGDQWKPGGEEDPLFSILGLLAATIGLPYFMLSTTGPLIQSWFAREQRDPVIAQRAYRLFALSNFGSLMGLLAYPFAIETWITTRTQAVVWSVMYGTFVVITVAVAWRAARRGHLHLEVPAAGHQADDWEPDAHAGDTPGRKAPSSGPPGLVDQLFWFSLSAIATMLLLAVSSHITQNIASIPFLWVLPLSLYLLTFVIAFEGRRGRGWYLRNTMLLPALVMTGVMAWGLVADDGVLDIETAIPMYLVGLFLVCLFCHGELAQAKPRARYLTRFYFMIALGGAAGGLFVSMVAPRIFSGYWELPLALMLAGASAAWVGLRIHAGPLRNVFFAGGLISIAVCVHYAREVYADTARESIYVSRNFYGTLQVRERYVSGAEEPVRRLVHGVILHGMQDMNPDRRILPSTYYGPSSGVGLAIMEMAKASPSGIRVGVIGLGVGTLASYGRKGDEYRIYDINPQVVDVAKTYFRYVDDSRALVSFALGDARLVLEREQPNAFDVLVIDAFSSDSIPIHLMTREALAVYARHIKPGGVIVFHVTNRFLRLAPVVRQIARDAEFLSLMIEDDAADDPFGLMAMSDWVLVTRNKDLLARPEIRQRQAEIEDIPGLLPWTDDFNNLYRVLK